MDEMTDEERLRIQIAISFIEPMAGTEGDAGDHSKYRFNDLKVAIEKGEIEAALAIAEEING
jgi:hypothetical protein